MAVAQETRLQHSLKMEPGIERPGSALTRGVQITEFNDSRVNPEPIVLEETDLLLEQFLSPRKLMLLTGVDNLDDIHQLEMKVNTTDTSLGNFGQLLHNLRQLKVSNSTIPKIRDLGSSLRSLHVLWASRCALQELDGISSIIGLRELYLSYNEISDISPVSMLEHIEILDVEGNNLDDIVQVQHLAICSRLTNLTLDGNPLCNQPTPAEFIEEYDYRQEVKKAIPHLKTLDDEPLIDGVGSFLKHNVRPPSGNRPSTAALKPNTGFRPGSALRPSSGFRPMTAGTRPASTGHRPATAIGGMRPSSGSGRPGSGSKDTGDASDLTLGRVICGNPSKALLSRRRLNPDAAGELEGQEQDIKFEPKFQHRAEHTYDTLQEEERDHSEIVDELKAWKQQHEKRMEIIRQSKAPQVLRIDYDQADDAISLSGDSDVDSDTEELSPMRDSDTETIHRVQDENIGTEGDQNCKVLPSVSSFVPVSVSPNESLDTPVTTKPRYSDSSKPIKNKVRRNVSEEEESDSLLRSSVQKPFKISDLASRQRAVIPPPSQRDVVRKHIDTSSQVRAQSPLGSLLSPAQGPMRAEARGNGAIRVNNTGLPPAPSSGVPIISKMKREEGANPVIKSGSYERAVPLNQRPSTARAALGMRRSLPTVPSLPSKPAPPKS
ncbi:LRC56-like protein [Mya arenaria]|uniref:LRC56-like protein n=1 Tax=Mya arenaria TaxID=6604 RepID=A0ABY7E6E2_MYAAR|nr:LRC56-like protein [Mya arenaria]